MLRRFISPPSLIAPNLVEQKNQKDRARQQLKSRDGDELDDSIEVKVADDENFANARRRIKKQVADTKTEKESSSREKTKRSPLKISPIRTYRGGVSIEPSTPLIGKGRKGILNV